MKFNLFSNMVVGIVAATNADPVFGVSGTEVSVGCNEGVGKFTHDYQAYYGAQRSCVATLVGSDLMVLPAQCIYAGYINDEQLKYVPSEIEKNGKFCIKINNIEECAGINKHDYAAYYGFRYVLNNWQLLNVAVVRLNKELDASYMSITNLASNQYKKTIKVKAIGEIIAGEIEYETPEEGYKTNLTQINCAIHGSKTFGKFFALKHNCINLGVVDNDRGSPMFTTSFDKKKKQSKSHLFGITSTNNLAVSSKTIIGLVEYAKNNFYKNNSDEYETYKLRRLMQG